MNLQSKSGCLCCKFSTQYKVHVFTLVLHAELLQHIILHNNTTNLQSNDRSQY